MLTYRVFQANIGHSDDNCDHLSEHVTSIILSEL